MARPKKENHPISIRMDKTLYDRLNEFCEVSGQPKTVAIERALAAYIDSYMTLGKKERIDRSESKQEA